MDGLYLPLFLDEVTQQLSRPASTKISEIDGIPAEIFKAARPEILNTFNNIMTSIWEEEIMPNDFCDAIIVTLFKNIGNKADCGELPWHLLLLIAGKILA